MSKQRLRPYFPLLPLFLFLLISIVYLFIYKEEISLGQTLKDIQLENISIDDKQFIVKNGKVLGETDSSTRQKVLHLAAFYQWTREDPLFYSPDLDVEEFSHSVDLLSKEHSKLIEVIGGSKHLHPVDFLESMSEVSALTREFLDKPSDILAEELIEKQKLVAQNYKEEATDLLDSLPQDEPSLVGFDIRVSYETTQKDLPKIIENGEKLLEEIEKRERCFFGDSPCIRPALGFVEPKDAITSDEQVQTLPKSLVFNRSEEKISKAIIRGPYKAKTICFGWGENTSSPTHSFFLEERTPTKRDGSPLASFPLIDIQLATEVFFKKLNPSTDVAELKELLRRGVEIIRFPSTNPYMCPERGFLAEISEVDVFIRDESPIFPDDIGDSERIERFFARAKEVEESFFTKTAPSYEDLMLLSNYYGYAYRLIVEYPNANWARNLYHLKDEFLERNLHTKRKLDNIHLVFNNATRFVNSLWARRLVEKDVDTSVFRSYAYSERNFYGLYFLPFSTSVWRSNELLQYVDKIVVKNALGPDASYMTYNQAQERYTQEDITSWSLVNRREVLEDLFLDVLQ